MACYDDSSCIKKFLSFMLTFSPFFLMNSASATVIVNDWNLGNAVVQGATTTWNATKNIGGKLATGVASIKPTPAQVAKGILKGGLVGAALTAAEQLVEDGVDYVLDPANNTIRYKPKNPDSSGSFLVESSIFPQPTPFSSLYQAADTICKLHNETYSGYNRPVASKHFHPKCLKSNGEEDYWDLSWHFVVNDEEKTIPITSVVSQVITNAEAEDEQAKVYVSAVAQTAVAEKEEDQIVPMSQLTQALEASQTITDEDFKPVDTSTSTDDATTATDDANTTTTTTPTDFKIPPFCSWASTACDWFSWTKQKYDESVKTMTDYFTEEPEEDKTDKEEIENPKFEADQVNLTANSQCPSKQVTFSLLGSSHTLDLPYQPVCDALEFFRPAVLCVGAISSVFIVAGVRSREEE